MYQKQDLNAGLSGSETYPLIHYVMMLLFVEVWIHICNKYYRNTNNNKFLLFWVQILPLMLISYVISNLISLGLSFLIYKMRTLNYVISEVPSIDQ